ncbi:Hypothetical protein Tpal_1147 [Trichococcus palustris]|jgi:L-ascorbate metabolism protein UlaG (beta-lactamase superfamily)|uniref:Metallo-beta-lactamase domain-containing protein n=1 Tax=Trichococcus palustris TaxID=140314 RepID=A0A143YFH9_9LACT|nr:Hypothetical protein Tpal_1147 [Trichococcus palustris]SFL14567.1 hypothetical protein SAMN04488076_12419 [Trichococcus palustris]
MPLLIDMPIEPEQVPQLDAVLITHYGNDHYSAPTCKALAGCLHRIPRFGGNGPHFVRWNYACPKVLLEDGIQRFTEGVELYKKEYPG